MGQAQALLSQLMQVGKKCVLHPPGAWKKKKRVSVVVSCIACSVFGVLNAAVLSRPGGQGFGGERLLFLAADML